MWRLATATDIAGMIDPNRPAARVQRHFEVPGYHSEIIEIQYIRDWWAWTSRGTATPRQGADDVARVTIHVGWCWTLSELRVLLAHEVGHVLQRENDPVDPFDRPGEDHGRRHRRATQAALAWIVPEVTRLGPRWAASANDAARTRNLNPWDNRRDTPTRAHDTALVALLDSLPSANTLPVRS